MRYLSILLCLVFSFTARVDAAINIDGFPLNSYVDARVSNRGNSWGGSPGEALYLGNNPSGSISAQTGPLWDGTVLPGSAKATTEYLLTRSSDAVSLRFDSSVSVHDASSAVSAGYLVFSVTQPTRYVIAGDFAGSGSGSDTSWQSIVLLSWYNGGAIFHDAAPAMYTATSTEFDHTIDEGPEGWSGANLKEGAATGIMAPGDYSFGVTFTLASQNAGNANYTDVQAAGTGWATLQLSTVPETPTWLAGVLLAVPFGITIARHLVRKSHTTRTA